MKSKYYVLFAYNNRSYGLYFVSFEDVIRYTFTLIDHNIVLRTLMIKNVESGKYIIDYML
jgi:hypothetical protein